MCSAYKDYQSDMMDGDDGRPDWFPRKACNYITATIGVKNLSINTDITQYFSLLIFINDRTAMAS